MVHFRTVTVVNTGVLSEDHAFRYSLTRRWDATLQKLLVIMHNPSKATEVLNDDTVMACQNIAWLIGDRTHPDRISTHVVDGLPQFGSIRVCNLFPAFATNKDLLTLPSSNVLHENDCEVARSCAWADKIICAWGKPKRTDREDYIRQIVRTETEHVLCFGHQGGHPMHPRQVKQLEKSEFPSYLLRNDSISTERRLLYRLRNWDIG
ncbi:MAG: DUF1643 domain-containing protein [Gammaproteobacteria bacterium]|nr:DUF1643 domain-containing protein [Gammaproteobacteria bacterium]